MRKPYFPSFPGQPEPLRAMQARRVRFEEVDPLGIVWHGRYPSFFEDGRMALGDAYGIGYMALYKQGVVAPVKKMHVDYLLPLHFDEEFTIEAILHFCESARINTEFVLRNASGQTTTTGYTVQMFLDMDKQMLIAMPEFYAAFCRRWQQGGLGPLL